MKFAVVLLACALTASAIGIDGVWTAQTTAKKGKNAGQTATFTLDLKSKDGKITGTVTMDGKKKPVVQSIQNGKLDGDRATFTTTQANKKASITSAWEITVGADRITGTRTREGARRGTPFTAKKAN